MFEKFLILFAFPMLFSPTNAHDYSILKNTACQGEGPFAYVNVPDDSCTDSTSLGYNDCRRWLITADPKDCITLCEQANLREANSCSGFNFVRTGVSSNGYRKKNGPGTCFFRAYGDGDTSIIRESLGTDSKRDCYVREVTEPTCDQRIHVITKCEEWPEKRPRYPEGTPTELQGNVEITCNGQDAEVVLIRAVYGRTLPYASICPYSDGDDSTDETSCSNIVYDRNPASNEQDISMIQNDYCDGNSCSIPTTNEIHTDPCLGIYKYLTVEYQCKVLQ